MAGYTPLTLDAEGDASAAVVSKALLRELLWVLW